jgi:dolichol kinase
MPLSKKIIVARKLTHMWGIFLVLIALNFLNKSQVIMLILALMIFYLAYLKGRQALNLPVLDKFLEERMKEKVDFGPVSYATGMIISLIIFKEQIALASIAILSIGDTFSALVGFFHGKNKIEFNLKKTIEGSLAFFITALIAALFFVDFKLAFFGALAGAIVEVLPIEDDNLPIPIVAGLVMSIV